MVHVLQCILAVLLALVVPAFAGCISEDSWDNQYGTENVDEENRPTKKVLTPDSGNDAAETHPHDNPDLPSSTSSGTHSTTETGSPSTTDDAPSEPEPQDGEPDEIDKKPWKTWRQQRDAHESMGVPARFHLEGNLIEFDRGTLSITDRMVLQPGALFPSKQPLVFFQNTTLSNGTVGTLVVQGEAINITGIETRMLGQWITVDDHVSWQVLTDFHDRPPALDITEEWHNANQSSQFATQTDLALDDAVVGGFDRAMMVTSNLTFPIHGPIRLSAEGVWFDSSSRVQVDEAEMSVKNLAIAGNFTGFIDVEGHGNHTDVLAIYGRNAHLLLEPRNVTSIDSVRVRQVVLTDEFLLPSVVEMIQPDQHVEVVQNQTTWIKVHVREASYIGVATFQNVTIEGTGAAAVSFPLERPPSTVGQMFEILDDLGSAGLPGAIAAPFMAIALGIAAPFVALAEALGCFFTTCYHLYPYPAWMEPGHIGVVYYPVTADLPPGEYDATITIRGVNYADVNLSLDFTVIPAE